MTAVTQRVLIVDDYHINRSLASLILRNAGIESEEAASGEEALQKLAASSFGCVLLDVNMPGLSGQQVCQRIRADSKLKHLRVIAYTAHVYESERQRILKSGFDVFIAKPISKARLLAAYAFACDQNSAIAAGTGSCITEPMTTRFQSKEITRIAAGGGAESRGSEPESLGGAGHFEKVIRGFDGDAECFAGVASKIAKDYQRYSSRIAGHARTGAWPALAAVAHKIDGSWSMYASAGEENLSALLYQAAHDGESTAARDLAASLATALDRVAHELRAWVRDRLARHAT